MRAALKKMFPGPLKAWSQSIVFPDDTRCFVPGSALQDRAVVRGVLERFSRSYGVQPDDCSLVSLWAQRYFDTVLPGLLGLSLVMERHTATALDQVSIVFDDCGSPVALRLDEPVSVVDTGLPGSLAYAWSLVDGHMEPFVMAISEAVHIAPRLLWSNAAWAGDWALSCLAVRSYRPRRAEAVREALANEVYRPSGQDNPLHHPVVRLDNGGLHRRLCCLRYRLPGFDTCTSICPGDTGFVHNASSLDSGAKKESPPSCGDDRGMI
ncbi:siderophore-iron reductase FhuF [Haematospirillum jordaniae]|uniref:Siderophore-iron reductase FhuF n=1 Tax=Haematospirillum jordaniae TaxID=1549855 RepID=A0A143DC97_9PROT|nr:siderophore-iron reductase FhuF [Haematospirillum jordaniae]AMW34219.1 hypothetical protein AY555_02400 [Haematospirillum jordaniae]NKD45058.1 siderophore-iron reductase FhuF [Haematospirillum jordaniae]NKD57123.1 siderophore-iron reductase FhuF [Haematospirillum jordaniae]NKD59356.1 siderophore-iron reductase FhuF [Haematospirillum jordaniae]NKD67049.1 siderophore-iron reductase FhuF [Haematospirillum jordaniae]